MKIESYFTEYEKGGMTVNLEQEIRKTVKDMLWLADELNKKADHDAVRWYRQGQADALRQWAKRLLKAVEK